jgi:hypothetical protein
MCARRIVKNDDAPDLDLSQAARHDQSRLRRMAERFRQRQDDGGAARSSYASLRHCRNRQRKLAVQKPRRIFKVSLTPPHTPRLRTLTTPPGRALWLGSKGVPFGCKSGVPIQCCLTERANSAFNTIDTNNVATRLTPTDMRAVAALGFHFVEPAPSANIHA